MDRNALSPEQLNILAAIAKRVEASLPKPEKEENKNVQKSEQSRNGT